MEVLTAILETLGPAMFLGLIGVYLITVSIVGQFIPRNIRLKTTRQRTLLGIFGFVLFLPTLVSLYIEFFTVFSPSIFTPETPEQVIDQEQTSGELPGEQATNAELQFAGILPTASDFAQKPAPNVNNNCQLVERFGLAENSTRRLKHSHFEGRVFISIDQIHYRRPFDVYIVIGDEVEWPKSGELSYDALQTQMERKSPETVLHLQVEKTGATAEFEYKNKRYQLKIDRIYAVLFGSDKVIISICEIEQKA